MKKTLSILFILFLLAGCSGSSSSEDCDEINITGSQDTTTDNFKLPECQKSIFIWQVNPGEDGTASVIIHLHHVNKDGYKILVNELEFNVTEPLSGEKMQALAGGEYFFSFENVNGEYRLTWECRD